MVAGLELTRMTRIALLLQRLAGLHARIVEFAGLANDDRTGADDEDGMDVCTLGHYLVPN